MKRRHFLTGAACALCSAALTVHSTAAEDEDFICSSVEPPQQSFEVDFYAWTEGRTPESINDAIAAAKTNFKLNDYGTAFLADRWREMDGLTPNSGVITLGIAFLSGSAPQQDLVRNLAVEWLEGGVEQRIAFRFDVPPSKAQIRISFNPDGGNNSLVGRQALLSPVLNRTMNLAQVTRRVTLHEFGHALGLKHEHMNVHGPIVWDEKKVISEMRETHGWSSATTRRNILQKLSNDASCVGDPGFNPQSIMLYPIPKRWTLNGFSSRLNTNISDRDRQCLRGVYSI
ncbi:hypothetical protein GOB99_15315 [Sinorhizobium meliloti]|nr:hypothetical protein [Sinorhizobium meliloti]MDX0238254.1 hypothetical protein [Sinorhizobium meliloti]